MPNYDYVLFDADNTLFDFDRAELLALRGTLAHRGYPVNAETERCYLTINRALWDQFNRGEISLEALVAERFARFIRAQGGQDSPAEMNCEYLTRLGQESCLLPGAEALCRALAPLCTLAIITNGVARAQRKRFAHSPLEALIPWLFISEELGWQKPQPQFFEAVLQEMDITDRRRAVVVGDSLQSDIQGGHSAGLDTVWYNPAHLPGLAEHVPTFEVADFDALADLLLS